mmetsp:Transcript_3782/g.6457  ORF Transcript_3782/g.6457 Transcript_3782/m.6457 type:complete len:140 (+) Transcript_3782:13-432(+)
MEGKSKIQEFSNLRISAFDSEGNEYSTVNDLWNRELDPLMIELEKKNSQNQVEGERIGNKENWYKKQVEYWDAQPATIDGVLGGYGKYHCMEAEYSAKVLSDYITHIPSRKRAFEVGGGIGRISKSILKEIFEEIDILD